MLTEHSNSKAEFFSYSSEAESEARNPYILRPCFWGLTLDHVSTFNGLKTQPRSTYQEHFNNQIQKPHATSTNNKTIQQEAS